MTTPLSDTELHKPIYPENGFHYPFEGNHMHSPTLLELQTKSVMTSRFSRDPFANAPFVRMDATVDNDPFLQKIFALRYQVYCIECQFLPKEEYPNEFETDHYDLQSTNFSALNSSGELTGCMRLVTAKANQIFPMNEKCTLFPDFIQPENEQAAEISRLIIKGSLRRRQGDNLHGLGREENAVGLSPTKITPYSANQLLLLSLYREMFRYCNKRNIRFLYASMEKSLARSLKMAGMCFVPIGPEADYYGQVRPYMLDLQSIECNPWRRNIHLAKWFINSQTGVDLNFDVAAA